MQKRLILGLVLLWFSAAGTWAQSNEFVDRLLSSGSVSVGQVSYLILVASDNISEDADEARAFELLQNLGWAPAGAVLDSRISLAEYSGILMRAFGLKGGVLYTLFPGPRYAYRELAARQVFQGRTDPSEPVDGPQAVRMLARIFDVLGVAQ